MLPVRFVVIHAYAEMLDSSTGNLVERVVLSVGIHYPQLEPLNFENLDPTACLHNFAHRMKFSKNEMQPIEPLDAKATIVSLESLIK